MKKLFLFLLLLGFVPSLNAQTEEKFIEKGIESIPMFRELLSLANNANYPTEIEKNILWCEQAFAKRGFTSQRLETPTVPLLLAERKSRRKKAKTVLIYLQIDGQPVAPAFWNQKNPFGAELMELDDQGRWSAISWDRLQENPDPEWRIFARSASDAKGPVAAYLAALDLILEENKRVPFHMKVIMDFEEELGSPQLPEAVVRNREALAADMLVIFDGPRHLKNEPTLTFGARGISTLTLKVFGPYRPQHSGHYGNYVPNPAIRLAQLIASMKDEYGRVTIPGYYDGISLDAETRKLLEAVPDDEKNIRSKMGIASPDRVAGNYQESIQYPSLNVRGMSSGWVGSEKRTIIPSTATAEIDMRLVIESQPERLIELVRNHIVEQGYYLTEGEPTDEERMVHDKILSFQSSTSYLAYRTDMDSEVGIWLNRALTKAFGRPPIRQRTSGGSIPISPFVNELGIPAVTVPTVNRDNNQHSPNENIRLGNYFDAIKTIYAILTEKI
jgi:acetylornithine deacetylase/succinyl-diaminopimelate desuccinylase-like protein